MLVCEQHINTEDVNHKTGGAVIDLAMVLATNTKINNSMH